MLAQARKGKTPLPPRIVLYGPEGVGKSTFGASAPTPIFIQTEDGLGEIDCAKLPVAGPAQSISEVVDCLSALASEPHDYQTVVIDSIDWCERIIWDEICAAEGVSSIELAAGGYGKGYTVAMKPWRESILPPLDYLRTRKGMAVILIAHAKVEKFNDPEGTSYDRYSPKLHKHACEMLMEWSDGIFFAHKKKLTEKEKVSKEKTRAFAVPFGPGGGDRVMLTTERPSAKAKSRYRLPDELPLSWTAFIEAMTAAQQ